MKLRIAIVGSHSTGKTTLLRSLSEYLDTAVVSEVAREKISESETLPHLMTAGERGEFQKGILLEQIRRENRTEGFLSDRSVFDAVAYSYDTPAFSDIERLAADHAGRRPYDRIFLLPIEFPMEGDGIRSEDDAYRERIETELKNVLDRSGARYEAVRGNREARLAACLESLGIDL